MWPLWKALLVRLVAPWTPHFRPDDTLHQIITVRGGVGISAYAPYRIATENTVFASPK
jgi:hypothetical protein